MASEFILYKAPGSAGFTLCRGRFQPIPETVEKGIVLSSFSKELQACMVPDTELPFQDPVKALAFLGDWFSNRPIGQEEEDPFTAQPYTQLVGDAIEAIRAGEMEKVVLARTKTQAFRNGDLGRVMDQLATDNPNAFVYLLSSKAFGVWLGATPELLLSLQGNSMETMALAGTLKPGGNGHFTVKDYEEQQIVQKEIQDILYGEGFGQVEVSKPELHPAGSVMHLISRIRVQSEAPLPDHFRLANRLHPTSAVSGYPREKAIAFIQDNEGFARGLYSGFIGVVGEGKANYYVNLRCGRLFQDRFTLFAGAGIVGRSVPEDELAETEAKMAVLNAAFHSKD